MSRVACACMKAGWSFGIGRELTPTGAGHRTGGRLAYTLMLTERGSTSGVHWAAASGFRVGRAVSGAIGAAWIIDGGTEWASVGASRLVDVRVNWAIIGGARNTVVDVSCMITAAGITKLGIGATPVGAARLILIVAMNRASIAGARLIVVRIEVTPVGTSSIIVVLARYISHVISDLLLHTSLEVQGLTNLDGTTSWNGVVLNLLTRRRCPGDLALWS